MTAHTIEFPVRPPSLTAAAVLTGSGLKAIIDERIAQIDRDGFGPKHDRLLSPGQVLIAGEAAVKEAGGWLAGELIDLDCAREALVRAGATIWATIDRIDAEQPLELTEVAP